MSLAGRPQARLSLKIYQIFMVPKPVCLRLFNSMQLMDTNWQMQEALPGPAVFPIDKEPKLKLSLETRNLGDVIVVHCQGRIVYRDEAAALSRVVGEILESTRKVVLDLSGVSALDSAGMGDLVLVQTRAQEKNADLKYAVPDSMVRDLLDLTNLDSVMEVHPSIESALAAFRAEEVCADC